MFLHGHWSEILSGPMLSLALALLRCSRSRFGHSTVALLLVHLFELWTALPLLFGLSDLQHKRDKREDVWKLSLLFKFSGRPRLHPPRIAKPLVSSSSSNDADVLQMPVLQYPEYLRPLVKTCIYILYIYLYYAYRFTWSIQFQSIPYI
jgi:hypothetical protein